MSPQARRRRGGGRPRGGGPSRRAALVWGSTSALLFAVGLFVGYRLAHAPDEARAPDEESTDGGTTPSSPSSPAAEATGEPLDRAPAEAGPGPLIALVVDDLGRSVADLDALVALEVPITYSVLPYEVKTPEVVERLSSWEVEVLCHLPMEADGGENPGPGALLSSMSDEELRRATRRALDAVPNAVGVNNHMGSTLSAEERAMRAVLEVLDERQLFFVDSRTSPRSVGYRLALEIGLPTAERQVFLDTDMDSGAIREAFRGLLEVADERGSAIAIAHPHPATLDLLAFEVPRARALGYRFVPVSYLLDRSGGPD